MVPRPLVCGGFVRKLATFVVALLVSSSALAATPPQGVPLQVRRGFFTETDIGGFFTLGGDDGYSNFTIYLQLGAGYQITINEGKGLIPIGVHVGISANAGNCWSGRTAAGTCPLSESFSTIFLNASAGYLHQVVERFYVGGKVLGGYTLLDPAPVTDVNGGANFGVAASIEYATNMDHFSIGLDVAYRFIIGPNISALMPYLRVQYTF
jgi:hypothetical protein